MSYCTVYINNWINGGNYMSYCTVYINNWINGGTYMSYCTVYINNWINGGTSPYFRHFFSQSFKLLIEKVFNGKKVSSIQTLN